MPTYTLSRSNRGAKLSAAKRESRKDQGLQLRALYRELGHDRAGAAKFLHVTPRTMFSWETGRTRIPFSALKLLRLLTRCELPGKDWEGWTFNRGTLWSPEGHGFNAKDFAWLSMTVRRAQLFGVLYRERTLLQLELRRVQAEAGSLRAISLAVQGHLGLIELAVDGGLPDGPASATQERTAARPGGPVRLTRSLCATGGTWAVGGEGLVTPHPSLTGATGVAA